MMSVESAMSGRTASAAPMSVEIVFAVCCAVHRGENAIRACLELAGADTASAFLRTDMRRDEIIAHIARMACHITQPFDDPDFSNDGR